MPFLFCACLFGPEHPAIPAGCGLRGFAVDGTDDTVADAFPLALDAEVFEQLLVLRSLELLLGAVDPDTAQIKPKPIASA